MLTQLAASGNRPRPLVAANSGPPVPSPVLDSVSPDHLAQNATATTVTFTGSVFTADCEPVFDPATGITVTNITYVDPTSITADVAIAIVGVPPSDVTVTIHDTGTGKTSASLPFTIDPALVLDDLTLDLSATAGTSTTTDGVGVASWTDQSPSGADVLQATGANQPIYKTNIQNGLPVLRFAGSQWMLTGGSVGELWTTDFTMYLVARISTPGTYAIIGNEDIALNTGDITGASNATDWGVSYGTGTTYPTILGDAYDANFHLITIIFDQSAVNKQRIRVDGVAGENGVAAYAPNVTQPLCIGRANTIASFAFVGDLGGVARYGVAHTDDQIAQNEHFLKTLWGTP